MRLWQDAPATGESSSPGNNRSIPHHSFLAGGFMKLSFLSLTIIAAAGSASMTCMADDLTVVSSVSTNGQPGGTQTSYISSDHIRHSESKGNDVIIDLKSGTMTNIDGKKKTYFVMTKQ